jgi:predicted nucleotidyltransferase
VSGVSFVSFDDKLREYTFISLYLSAEVLIIHHMTEELQSAVDSAVEALTSALNPKQIYLFGSCARGTAIDGSDIDLLVVVEDGSGDKLSNTSKAYRATRQLNVSKDIIVDQESVFKKRARWVSSIEREVMESGKLVYGRS